MWNNSYYGNFDNLKFSDVWDNADTFLTEYQNNGIPNLISDSSATTLYYLLYSRFGNSTIAASDTNRFKYNVWSIIWQFGPAWQRKLEIQQALRELSDDDILEGSKQIYNKAFNPATEPGVLTDEELEYINDQTVAKQKKGRLEGYAVLVSLLEDDVTEKFLSRFNKLFIKIVMPDYPLWYTTEDSDSSEE